MDRQLEMLNDRVHIPTVKEASILFSTAVFLFVIIGSRAQRYDLMTGVLFTEFILLAGSALIFLKYKGYNVKEVLRLNKAGIVPFILTFFIMLFVIPAVSIINLANLSIIQYFFGRVLINQPAAATNPTELLINIAIIGGSAGICEEVLFRGVIQRAYEGFGWKKGIVLTGFLFGMMHMDFQKLLGTFILGVLIGYLVYRSRSLYIGMFAHFCNNSLAVIISYWANKASNKMSSAATQNGDLDLSFLMNLSTLEIAVFIITWLFILGVCVSVIVAIFIAFNRCTEKYAKSEKLFTYSAVSFKGLIYIIPAILLIIAIYFYQGYKLSFVKVPFLEEILQFIMGK